MVKKNKDKSLCQIKFEKFLKNNSAILIAILVFFVMAFAIILNSDKGVVEDKVFGDDVIDMYYFHLRNCPHCHEQNKFHKTLLELYPNLRINEYEMSSSESVEKYKEFATRIGGAEVERWGTPTTFIGTRSNVGFGSPETTGQILIEMIEEEQTKIDSSWTEGMVKTVDLR